MRWRAVSRTNRGQSTTAAAATRMASFLDWDGGHIAQAVANRNSGDSAYLVMVSAPASLRYAGSRQRRACYRSQGLNLTELRCSEHAATNSFSLLRMDFARSPCGHRGCAAAAEIKDRHTTNRRVVKSASVRRFC